MKVFLRFLLPLYLTYAYQLIPVPVRKLWGMRGDGSSHVLVTIALMGGTGNLWPDFFRCCRDVVYLPGYLAGSVVRLLRLMPSRPAGRGV